MDRPPLGGSPPLLRFPHSSFPEAHIRLNRYAGFYAVEEIDHSRTKTKGSQTNTISERLHKTRAQ